MSSLTLKVRLSVSVSVEFVCVPRERGKGGVDVGLTLFAVYRTRLGNNRGKMKRFF